MHLYSFQLNISICLFINTRHVYMSYLELLGPEAAAADGLRGPRVHPRVPLLEGLRTLISLLISKPLCFPCTGITRVYLLVFILFKVEL